MFTSLAERMNRRKNTVARKVVILARLLMRRREFTMGRLIYRRYLQPFRTSEGRPFKDPSSISPAVLREIPQVSPHPKTNNSAPNISNHSGCTTRAFFRE
ncbi:MAG: hypothetical protein LBD47_10520 [Treponema sp.]|jgi:hypothetical protein|nr:hypothetical protein [Treponema sp.]